MTKSILNDRSQQILKALIVRYIREGQPVASKTIAEDASFALSPATIRHILADLEEAGYIKSPHTSAGRIPTVLGYRFFVNSLLLVNQQFRLQSLEDSELNLKKDASEQELIESVSTLISSMTQLAGIVTVPRHHQITFRHIEFLSLSQKRVLVILVFNEKEVQNLIMETDREYSESELQQAANYLTTHYNGKNLIEIRQLLLNEMRSDHQHINHIMHAVFDAAQKTVQKQQEDYIIAGESHLFNIAEEGGINQLRQLFDAFTQKNDLLCLLDRCLEAKGVQIFIGHESGNHIFERCSLITAPYAVDEKILGVLGVIGPTRMDYEKAIIAVDVTAKLLSAVLKDRITTN